MRSYYRIVRAISVIGLIVIAMLFIPTIAVSMAEQNLGKVFASVLWAAGLSSILIFHWAYHRNLVVDVSFEGDKTYIKTNAKTFCLPSVHFVEVIQLPLRVIMKYEDATFRKKFVFDGRYFFQKRTLDMVQLRTHMIHAVFRS